MKPQTILFVLILITTSCATQKEFPRTYGNYCSEITLNPNKTFEYREACTGLGGEFIRKGTWRQGIADTILLNTYEQPKIAKTTYKGKVNPNMNGKIKIQVSDKDGALGYVNILINDKTLGIGANDKGFGIFQSEMLKNVTYNFLGQEETIQIDNPNYNEIEILIRDLDTDIVPNYFTDMPFVVTKNKIVLYPNDKEKRYEKKRIKKKRKIKPVANNV
ncbi:hypothetical protein [Tenacibaculum jejuense]|uniref:Lipoprotein n=1 Tax=Tenacibaculum jejuense TaxID=584609 RepID=A0A238U513_9FLAO|nr:hypothetical protein [Tenacibaculum jejuense]SNR14182.1 conserved protein of unknown function [Tenacibaculum jejuense]